MTEYGRLSEGLKVYRDAMRPWVARRLRQAQPVGDWFELLVVQALTGVQADNVRRELQREEGAGIIGQGKAGPEQVLDIHHFRRVISYNWERVFARVFQDRRLLNWIEEVGQERNTWAHPPDGDLAAADVTRVLDSCARVLEYVDKGVAGRLKALRDGEAAASGAPALTLTLSQRERESPSPSPGDPGGSTATRHSAATPPMEGRGPATAEPVDAGESAPSRAAPQAPAAEPAAIVKTAPRGLRSWRDVVKPHPDVQQGRYQKAEFAADLQEVVNGKASAEYGDPQEFFRRTFVTADMHRLLVGVVQRLRGQGGDPVIDLKTAFGGGKTHTLLAVHHLVNAAEKLQGNQDLQHIFAEAGGPPPRARTAVLVGTYLDPVAPSRHQEATGGVEVNTLWGELAYQLGGLPGYRLVQEHDHHRTPPGSDVLSQLFALAGPCAILIDELVAYLRVLPEHPSQGYPGGTQGAHMTFCQALTEAARRAPNVVVLASIPQTQIEYGDSHGERIAAQISNVFQRIGAPWQPVSGHEAFEVVRRRLFGAIEDEAARDATCEAFGRLYREDTDFPAEAREPAYVERLRASYPIHPEIFERLYVDWAGTIDRFQRTRGVLRLMADAIHRLWASKDPDPMILPGALPLYDSNVRQQLVGYLNDNWNGPFDADIDGDMCEAALAERAQQRFGHIQACRRLTRTIFLGSVPGKSHVGLETGRIMLGTVQPGEGVSVYGDALRTLSGRLSFLYGSEQRYWFEVRPNLNKVAADRIARVGDEEAGAEIRALLQAMKDTGDFAGVHRAPGTPADVADEPAARLVLLGPEAAHKKDDPASEAIRAATRLLDSRGTVPRQHRNMLAFLAADGEGIQSAREEAKRYLGWRSIAQDGKTGAMNLDRGQQTQAEASRDAAARALEARLHDAYKWLLVPQQLVPEGGVPEPLSWQAYNLSGAGLGSIGSLVQRASYRMVTDGLLIKAWSPIHLKRELDRWVWQDGRDHVSLKQVWGYLTTYLYFSRLRSVDVLIDAVKTGVRSRDYFGYADGLEGDRYLGLVFGEPARLVVVDEASVLVRPAVAAQQVETKAPRATAGGTAAVVSPAPGGEEPEPPKPRPVRRFFGTARLSPTRLGGSAGQIGEEVVQHLNGLLGAEVEVTIEIHARVPEGIPDAVVRTVSENARTLKFAQFEFDEE